MSLAYKYLLHKTHYFNTASTTVENSTNMLHVPCKNRSKALDNYSFVEAFLVSSEIRFFLSYHLVNDEVCEYFQRNKGTVYTSNFINKSLTKETTCIPYYC